MKKKYIKIKVPFIKFKNRLDYILSKILFKYSRSHIKFLINNKKIKINNNTITKPNTNVNSYDIIKIFFIIIINIYYLKI
ncbi:S4 domain-containing protein [Candidatus Annandia pinicola]|uniref:S4 domain-containing protein n=1 Tax=Candidatus Annandia pinicola TaxID=1345117 RepID=UPI001D03482A|nr:S4 domain-containing protein [Candidatus Annandia pinicola]